MHFVEHGWLLCFRQHENRSNVIAIIVLCVIIKGVKNYINTTDLKSYINCYEVVGNFLGVGKDTDMRKSYSYRPYWCFLNRMASSQSCIRVTDDLGHGPDKISVPPKVAKLQWCKFICYINIS